MARLKSLKFKNMITILLWLESQLQIHFCVNEKIFLLKGRKIVSQNICLEVRKIAEKCPLIRIP